MRDACIPNMGHAQRGNFGKCLVGKVIKLAHSIFLNGSPRLIGGIGVSKQTGKNLINHWFFGVANMAFNRDCTLGRN